MPASRSKALATLAGSSHFLLRRVFRTLVALVKPCAMSRRGLTITEAIYGVRFDPDRRFTAARVLDRLPAAIEDERS